MPNKAGTVFVCERDRRVPRQLCACQRNSAHAVTLSRRPAQEGLLDTGEPRLFGTVALPHGARGTGHAPSADQRACGMVSMISFICAAASMSKSIITRPFSIRTPVARYSAVRPLLDLGRGDVKRRPSPATCNACRCWPGAYSRHTGAASCPAQRCH